MGIIVPVQVKGKLSDWGHAGSDYEAVIQRRDSNSSIRHREDKDNVESWDTEHPDEVI
jgi:hypothetical protein